MNTRYIINYLNDIEFNSKIIPKNKSSYNELYGDIIIQGATTRPGDNGVYEFYQILNDHPSYKKIGSDYYIYKWSTGNTYIGDTFNSSYLRYYTSSTDIYNAKWTVWD